MGYTIEKARDRLKDFFFGSMTRTILTFYASFTLMGAILLTLPMSTKNGATISFIDALFISASGMSTTGLSPITISEVLSPFGIGVLAFIIQFGGIGIMMLIGMVFLAAGRKITYRQRSLIMADQNQYKMNGVVKLLKNVIGIIFFIELIGFILLTLGIYYGGYYESIGESMAQSVFLTISMTTNAGFDISGQSLIQYKNDYFIQSVAMFLMFSGAVGFWPLIEFKEWIISKFKRQKFEFSLLAKIMFLMHVSLWIIGAILFALLENGYFLAGKGIFEGTFYSLFMSLTTRNAGFTTIMDLSQLRDATNWLFSAMMFVGSSPNSAGGGIRTTTFLLIVVAVVSFARGNSKVIINKKTIKQETVLRSFLVFFMALFVVFAATLIISLDFEENVNMLHIIYEVSSAFGTTGLSLGITSMLSTFSKVILILTMFIGRVGVVAILLIFKPKKSFKSAVEYPEIDMIVG